MDDEQRVVAILALLGLMFFINCGLDEEAREQESMQLCADKYGVIDYRVINGDTYCKTSNNPIVWKVVK